MVFRQESIALTESLADELREDLHRYCDHETSTLYRRSPSATLDEIDKWVLEHYNGRCWDTFARLDGLQDAVQYRLAICALMKYLFCFFWPVDLRHNMATTFWGALHTLLRSVPYPSEVNHTQVSSEYIMADTAIECHL